MGFMDTDLNEVQDIIVLEPGEYQLRCVKAEVKVSAKGNEYLNLRLDIPEIINADDVYYMLMAPDGNDPKVDNKRKIALRTACEAFGVPYDAIRNPEMFEGNMVWAVLGVEDDEEYGPKNRVKRIIQGA